MDTNYSVPTSIQTFPKLYFCFTMRRGFRFKKMQIVSSPSYAELPSDADFCIDLGWCSWRAPAGLVPSRGKPLHVLISYSARRSAWPVGTWKDGWAIHAWACWILRYGLINLELSIHFHANVLCRNLVPL